MKINDIWMVYSTFPQREEAFSVATELLEKRLIACANIHENVTSLYHWEGTINQEPEVVLMAKTHQAQVTATIEEIKRLHGYQLPCIVAYPLPEGYGPFMQWVTDETAEAK
jgi:periplasmic divalent cation tolerance protein